MNGEVTGNDKFMRSIVDTDEMRVLKSFRNCEKDTDGRDLAEERGGR